MKNRPESIEDLYWGWYNYVHTYESAQNIEHAEFLFSINDKDVIKSYVSSGGIIDDVENFEELEIESEFQNWLNSQISKMRDKKIQELLG
jgi:glutamine amidotransferase-like uncharacterized protein